MPRGSLQILLYVHSYAHGTSWVFDRDPLLFIKLRVRMRLRICALLFFHDFVPTGILLYIQSFMLLFVPREFVVTVVADCPMCFICLSLFVLLFDKEKTVCFQQLPQTESRVQSSKATKKLT
jgi:hypothetical protein